MPPNYNQDFLTVFFTLLTLNDTVTHITYSTTTYVTNDTDICITYSTLCDITSHTAIYSYNQDDTYTVHSYTIDTHADLTGIYLLRLTSLPFSCAVIS